MSDAPLHDNPRLKNPNREFNHQEALEQIRQALHGLKFGHVTAVVQDGIVVLVERVEKKRLV